MESVFSAPYLGGEEWYAQGLPNVIFVHKLPECRGIMSLFDAGLGRTAVVLSRRIRGKTEVH